jgi:hypothetical protein
MIHSRDRDGVPAPTATVDRCTRKPRHWLGPEAIQRTSTPTPQPKSASDQLPPASDLVPAQLAAATLGLHLTGALT